MKNNTIISKAEFDKLLIALKHTDHGFLCFTTVFADGQKEAAEKIAAQQVFRPAMSYDCALQERFNGFSFINELINEHPAIEVFILYNFQHLAFSAKGFDFFQALNFSRDPWANLQKLFVLGMTEELKKQIMLKAPDFHSFFLTSFHFDLISPKIADTRQEITYDKSPAPAEKIKLISKNRYDELLQKVVQQSGDFTDISSESTQVFLDFLEAWVQYAAFTPAERPQIISSVLAALQKKAATWEHSLATAYNFEIIARAYEQLKQYDEAAKYLESAAGMVVDIQGNDNTAAYLYSKLGNIALERRDFAAAESWYKKSLEIFLKQGDEQNVAVIYHQLGRVAQDQWDLTAAEGWYNKSLEIKLKLGDEHGAATTYHQLGIVAHERQDFAAADDWYKKALEIFLKPGNEHGAASTYHQLGRVAQKRRDFAAAEGWYKKSLEISLNHDYVHNSAFTYGELGNLALERRDFAAAKGWYEKSLEIFLKQGDEHNAASTYHQLGIVAQERRDFAVAEGWYKKALEIKLKQGNEHGAASTYTGLGALSLEQRDFAAAEALFKQALDIFERYDDPHDANIAKNNLTRLKNIRKRSK